MSVALRAIPAHYLRSLLLRGVWYWVLVRIILTIARSMRPASFTGPLPDPLLPTPFFILVTALLTGFLAFGEVALHRERLLAGNLGMWYGWFALLPALVALTLELILAITMRLP